MHFSKNMRKKRNKETIKVIHRLTLFHRQKAIAIKRYCDILKIELRQNTNISPNIRVLTVL